MRVATFNLHAGVDGWGRPSNALEHACELGADVLVCPETWRGDDGTDFVATIERRLAMHGLFVPLARAQRVTSGRGPRSWQPVLAHFTGERGLYFNEYRVPKPLQRRARDNVASVETGEWGLGFFTTLPITSIHSEPIERLKREKSRRALIVAELLLDEQAFHLLAVHGAHLTHGSYRQYRRINAIAATLDPALPVILAGDFNCWRPLLRILLPGWTTLVRTRTWPARHPHSQIDHILGRGPWEKLGGNATDGGSDHRALVAEVRLRAQNA